MARNRDGDDQHVASILKAFDVVDALEATGPTTVSALADDLDMPVSTVYVYVKTLQETGYVVEKDGEYDLGLRFLQTGGRVRRRLRVFQAAHSELLDLCWSVGERVGLGVEENGRRVQLLQFDGESIEYDNNYVGEHTHLHWTSLGKVLLASLSDDEVHEVVDEYGLPRATEHTITDVDALLREIEHIRAQGYAIEDEERTLGMRSVSVPLRDADGNTRAAIGIAAAKSRMGSATCSRYVRLLQEKANIISLRFHH